MVKYKNLIFSLLIVFFLLFSFYPTIYELQNSNKLADAHREFVLEHNYYWPDYNLYLSKIRQGMEGRFTAKELYTGEKHQGSLIQEFYVVLGWLGRILNLDPNSAYLLGRIIFAPLLLLIIYKLTHFFFPSANWRTNFQFLAFIIVVVSGSFPRIYADNFQAVNIGRYMEWWSNIDALQRITFIPHILFGQVVSFYLLYQLTMNQKLRTKNLFLYIILGNLIGLTFPPSLITLNTVLVLIIFIKTFKKKIAGDATGGPPAKAQLLSRAFDGGEERQDPQIILFLIATLPSLLYIFIITKFVPWSTLIAVHRENPLLIPLDQYVLATGPIFILGIAGAVVSILRRERQFEPLILWITVTLGFASFFQVLPEQSPLRFTQTGLFIPLGILTAYLFYHLFHLSDLSLPVGLPDGKAGEAGYLGYLGRSLILFYLLGSLYMMKTSLTWQTGWIAQKIAATHPAVPYPPQAMYPLTGWMDGIRWLRDNTKHEEIVLAAVTAGNYIPAYSGNTVYFGQANTVNYYRKQDEAQRFFKGDKSPSGAEIFLAQGRIKYVFYSIQEKELSGGKNLEEYYPFLTKVYTNDLVTIYSSSN